MTNEENILKLIAETKKILSEKSRPHSANLYAGMLDLIESLIHPQVLTDTGKINIMSLVDKFGPEKFIMGVKEAERYLRREQNITLTSENIEEFLFKLPRVLSIIHKSPIEKKTHYIYGIARNRFGNWSIKKMSKMMKIVIEESEENGLTEEQIIQFLDSQFIPYMKEARNWTEFRDGLPEHYTE